MAENEIVLFDLRSKPPNSTWSLNPWKTRLCLNFKGLDYRTEWLEYPEIRPTLEPHLPPNGSNGSATFTIPAVKLTDGTYMMESEKIAPHLEALHPEPSLRLDSAYLTRITAILSPGFNKLRPVTTYAVQTNLLDKGSTEYFYRTRSEAVGVPLETLAEVHGVEKSYDAFAPTVREVTAMLKENTEGPFFEGKTPGYADFVWIAFLLFIKRIGQEYLDEIMKRSGDAEVQYRLLEAAAPWYKRNDY